MVNLWPFLFLEMIQPSFKEFCQLAKQGNLIPVYQELLMDLGNAAVFFQASRARPATPFCLKASKAASAGRAIRFSALGRSGFSKRAAIKSKSSRTAKRKNDLRRAAKNAGTTAEGLPAGAGARCAALFRRRLGLRRLRRRGAVSWHLNDKKDPLGMPEIFFLFVQTLIAFDNLKHTIKVIDNVQVDRANQSCAGPTTPR